MPPINFGDTIAAVSTPLGEGGIAVIRVSGSEAISLVSRLFHSSKSESLKNQETHTIHHGHLVDEKERVLDEVLVSLFRSPHSYTGEDVAEISCHGGVRLTRDILECLVRCGARHADPGEFTRRAFLHGKLDLIQVEAVLDMIRARSEASLEAACYQLQGNLSRKIGFLKESLMKIFAHLEAGLDFPDERLDVYSKKECSNQIKEVKDQMQSLIASFKRGARLREGLMTVIVGRPNAGKSSLLNALLERDRALVSDIPGTTRDALEEEVEIGGIGLRLVDTAGLGLQPKDRLEEMGIERTRRYLAEGDLFLVVCDGSADWNEEDEAIFKEIKGKNLLIVVNKSDLPQRLDLVRLEEWSGEKKPCFISCLTGSGLSEMENRIEEKIAGLKIPEESTTLTRLRHKQALEEALTALERFEGDIERGISSELALIDLKSALDSLRELIGEVYSESLLDVIFQEFCIGK